MPVQEKCPALAPSTRPVSEGSNLLIEANAAFEHLVIRPVDAPTPERDRPSLKLVPGHPDEFIYMKSVELIGKVESWVGAADVMRNLLADENLDDFKCEGIEFV
jgi:soluble calcium-activated nucleotidase 1